MSKFSFEYDETLIIPKVIKSRRRKTVSLEVRHGELTIRVPVGTPEKWIQQFIEQRHAWIVQHMTVQLVRQKNHQINPYDDHFVPLRGQSMPVSIAYHSKKSDVRFCQEMFEINMNERIGRPPESVANTLLQAKLKEIASAYLIPRTLALAKEVGLQPTYVRIGNYKTMWGRCSARGDIGLNWRLIMADPEAIDYVIIHELCHLHEFNHSAAFWKKVGFFCRDVSVWRNYFKERSVWLSWR